MLSSKALTQSLRVAAPRGAQASKATSIAVRRSYATEAESKKGQHIKPPVALFGIDGTYATALYTAALKSSSLDASANGLNKLAESFKSDPKLASIMHTPTLSAEDKKQIVNELIKVAGTQDKTFGNFLQTLANNNRLGYLPGVCDKFVELMSAHRGEVELRITSAAPLESKVLKQLEQSIGKSEYVGQGKKLKTVPIVRPDIKGGLIVEIGDRTIDLSVSQRMAKMNKMLRDTL